MPYMLVYNFQHFLVAGIAVRKIFHVTAKIPNAFSTVLHARDNRQSKALCNSVNFPEKCLISYVFIGKMSFPKKVRQRFIRTCFLSRSRG